jgi:DNA modification methylase
MAKTLEDVAKSREERERVRQLLGCIPESILLHDKSDQATDLLVEEGGRDYTSTFHVPQNEEQERNKHLFNLSGAGARWGALSRFPQNIGRLLLKLYTKPGQTVVDPFAGHNSRMEFCYRAGRNYIGCDISHKFMEANFKLREMLLEQAKDDLFGGEHFTATIELHEADSRKMPVKNNAGDFTITSPPYWDLEYYGDEMGQLGKDNSYAEFLNRLGAVCCENFRCLKSGSFCVWCINDFRKDGKFYSYHMDTARLLRDAGFKMHDTAIIDLGGSFGQAFASQIVENKILPKRHEYAVIFVKP